ncbi:ArsR/SmtB family transcription factor [Winogradskya humida]|uniref:Transcriptional regulator n=1 Tax=Winogradskya humida TaxID=113566 RepID=A0ABQ3ZGZ3_9ACTN|nr:helix-turn-helix domain-containing protein [Actinoplanes humidus]GIE17789.1 transcriptional regulator [Actinoplanes humidus]
MIRYELESADVSAVRFGISPLGEVSLGLRALRAPDAFPLQQPWLDRIAPVRQLLDTEVLLGLVNDRRWVADFTNPRPGSPLTDFGQEIAELARITPERLRGDLRHVHGDVPPVFDGPHDEVVARLVAALTQAWDLCFVPYWKRMRAVLEADITYRGRVAAQAGIGTMLGGLSSSISFDGRNIDIRLASPIARVRPIRGEGVTLVPSMFVGRSSTPADETLPPVIVYPARGQGAMWSTADRPGTGAIRDLLGSTRATLLAALGEPASSTDLALRLGVTTSAVNQHLRVLERGGLLNRARYGRSILYYRSDLGESLAGN